MRGQFRGTDGRRIRRLQLRREPPPGAGSHRSSRQRRPDFLGGALRRRGELVTTSNSFTAADLRNGSGTALIIHQDPGNFGNIPPARYTQKNGTPGPDEETLATGDSGKRVACGVIAPAASSSTTATPKS